jgi:hypothetical protein
MKNQVQQRENPGECVEVFSMFLAIAKIAPIVASALQ